MTELAQDLTLAGLILDGAGVAVLFAWGAPGVPSERTRYVAGPEDPRRRGPGAPLAVAPWWAPRIGLELLALGFPLQAAAVWIR